MITIVYVVAIIISWATIAKCIVNKSNDQLTLWDVAKITFWSLIPPINFALAIAGGSVAIIIACEWIRCKMQEIIVYKGKQND